MVNQTHYQTLDVDENASQDMIKFAYQRLLKDAKDKLQDSPLYFEKEQNLKHAYQVLSSPSLRQAYNNKLARESVTATNNDNDASDSFNAAEFFGGLFFSKAFLGSVVLIIILLVILPSGEERVVKEVVNKQLDYDYDVRNQQMELSRQKEERNASSQEYRDRLSERQQESREISEQRRIDMEERRLELQEQREMEKIAREDRLLALKEERAARQAEYDLKRQKETERKQEKYRKQQEEYKAKRRSREFIERTERTAELQKEVNSLRAGYN